MKKYLIFLLMLIVTVTAFSEMIELQRLRINTIPPQMVIDMKGLAEPEYIIDYDKASRLLFLEFPGSSLATNFKNNCIEGKYLEKVDVLNYPESTAVIATLKKNVNFKTSYRTDPLRFVMDFSGKSDKKEYTVVIDAGHGGKDPGALGYGKYKEKDVVFSVANYIKKDLSKDFNVIMTRSGDNFVTLGERPKLGNRNKADFFISVHANAALDAKASGFEAFYFSKQSSPYAQRVADFENSFGEKYGENASTIAQIMGQLAYDKNKEESVKLGKDIAYSYSSSLKMKNRGVHGANFAVLRGFDGPGILLELGFISNYSDLTKLKSDAYNRKMSKEIASSIRSYFYK